MKLRNRILALLITLTMTFTYMPVIAFATEGEAVDVSSEITEDLDEAVDSPENSDSEIVTDDPDAETAVPEVPDEQPGLLRATGGASEIEYATEEDALNDGFQVEKYNDNEYRLKAYTGTEESVVLPSKVAGLPVSYVGSYAFNENESLVSVIIPSAVKELSDNTFYKCTSLKNVEIYGNCVNKYITRQWVSECGVLDSIYLGKDVTLYYESDDRIPVREYIVDQANTVYSVRDRAVIHQADNKIVLYPTNSDATNFFADITSVDGYAFYDNKNLTTLNLAFDGTAQSPCGSKCFGNMKALETLTVQGISAFYTYTIEGSTSLKQVLVTGNGNATVGLSTADDISVDEFIIGEGVKVLDTDRAWRSYSPNYTNLVIGKDVGPVPEDAYYDDPYAGIRDNIKNITIDDENASFVMKGGALFSKDEKVLYAYNMHMTSELTYNIPDGTEEIYSVAFWGNPEVYVINIPDTVIKIGNNAFGNVENLSYIYIPESVKYIDGSIVDNDVTIYGIPGSLAEEYAEQHGLTFISSEKMEETIGTEDYAPSTWADSETEEITPVNDTYIIQNAAQLAWLAEANNSGQVDFTGKTAKLAADINLDGLIWTPIGTKEKPFRGSFDGQGHKISGMTLADRSGGDTGFFGRVANKTAATKITIKNIVFKKVTIRNCSGVGVLAGIAGVTSKGADLEITDISVSGKTEQVSGAAGIVASIQCGLANTGFRIAKCDVKMNFDKTSGGTAGGIVCDISAFDSYSCKASAKGSIEDCSYEGTMSGSGRYHASAGIVKSINEGTGKYTIKNCVARGKIYAGSAAGIGGIITGVGKNVTLECCLNLAEVNGGYDSGGIAANNSGLIYKCENDGYVNLGGMMANNGGIVGGNSGTIRDSVNLGEVAARYYSGGIAGNNSGTIERCYNAGDSDGMIGGIRNIGGLSGYQTGTVDYSYADVPASASSLYGKGGFVDTPTSKERSTEQMKSEASYETWDFDTVWEFDSQYCWGYPVIRDIKPLLPKHPDRGSDHASENEAQIFVVDQDGELLSGVTVTYGSGSDVSTGVTDSVGSVILDHKAGMKGIEADIDGYVTYSDPLFTLPKTHEYTIRLLKIDGMDPYALSSAILNYNTNRYELLAEEKELNISYKNTQFSIDTKLAIPDNMVDHYELIQPKFSDSPIAVSEDGTFSNLKIGDFGLTTYKKSARDIFIRVYDTNNQPHDTKINLRIVKVSSKDLGSIKFNDDLKIHVSDDIPVFGGTDIEMPTAKFPLVVEISEDEWEVSVNVGELSKKGKDKLKLELLQVEKSGSEAYEDFNDTLAKYGKNKPVDLSKNPSLKLGVIGYASGDMPLSGTSDIEFKIYVGFSATYSKEWPVHGVVVAVDIKGTIYGDGTIEIKHYEQSTVGRPGEEGELYETWDWEGQKMDVGGSVEVSLSLLIGLPYLISGGVEGKGEMGYVHELFTKLAGPKEWYITGSAGITGRLNGSEAIYWPLLKPEDKLYLYRRDTGTSRSVPRLSSLKSLLKDTSEESPDTISRDSYTPTADAWNGGTAGAELLMNNAYPDMAPQMISANGKTVMLFLDDGDKNRATDDKSMLMYSVYDPAADTWSTPAAVWDDATADFAFSTYSDGTNAFVTWNNAKGNLTPGSSLVDKGKETEIAFASFDGDKFTNAVNITNNSDYETLPKITFAGGKAYVCWKVNSEDDIFGTSGTNSVYVAAGGPSWTISKIADISTFITNDSIGLIDDEPYYTYIAQNGSENEYLPHLMSLDGTDVTLSDENAVNIGFAKLNDGSRVFWTGVDGVMHTADKSGQAEDTGLDSTGLIKQIVESPDGQKAIIFTRNLTNKSNAYVMLYDPEKSVWSDEIALTDVEENNYVEMVSGQFVNGELLVTYNQRNIDISSGDYNGTNSLHRKKLGEANSHLVVADADFNEFELEAGAALPVSLTLSNKGVKSASRAKITVSNADDVLYEETVDLTIPGGGKASKDIELSIPSGFTKSDLKFNVTDPDNESVFDDSALTLTMGKGVLSTDLKKYCFNGKYQFVLSVKNSGYDTVNGVVEFYDLATGKIIEQYDFRQLGSGQTKEIRTNLDQLDWEEINSIQIGARIKSATNNAIIGDADRRTVVVQDTPKHVEYVKISQYKATLTEADPQIQLSAEVMPEDAYNKKILWKSEDPTIALVDENGLVTAVSGGSTRIYAYSEDGNKAVSCTVTCDMPKRVRRIYMKDSTVKVNQFKKTKIEYTVKPADASLDNITFMVDDPSIARISKDGEVLGLKPGETKVTVASDGKTDSCRLIVEENSSLTGAIVSKDVKDFNSDNLTGSSTRYLYVSDDPDTKYIMLTFDKDTYVYWANGMYISGSDEFARTFEGRELSGTTVIVPGFYALLNFSNVADYCQFKVTEIKEIKDDVIRIEQERETISQLDGTELSFSYTTIDKGEIKPTWTSSDESIATVDENGYAYGYLPGDVVMTASADGLEVKYPITVEKDDNVLVTDSVEDLHSQGPYEDDGNKYYIYTCPDEDAAYLKVTFSEDTDFTEYWTGLYVDTGLEAATDSLLVNQELLENEGRTIVVKGNQLVMNYNYTAEEEGGFRIESIEALDKLDVRSLDLEETEITMEEGEYRTIEFTTDPPYCKHLVECSIEKDDDGILELENSKYIYAYATGTAYVKVKIEGLEKTCKVTVTAPPPVDFTIEPNEEYAINNGVLTPELVVRDTRYGYLLSEGYDYTISINGYTVTVTGLDYYEGIVKTITIKSGAADQQKTDIAKGTSHKVNNNTFKVLSSSTVAFTKAKNARSVTVPATVKIGGKTFKVTQINSNAFKGKNIRTVTIGKYVKVIKGNAFKGSRATKLILKTKLLKKARVKGCLKGSKIRTVQVKVGAKAQNRKYVKAYKKIFTKKNAGKKVTVK